MWWSNSIDTHGLNVDGLLSEFFILLNHSLCDPYWYVNCSEKKDLTIRKNVEYLKTSGNKELSISSAFYKQPFWMKVSCAALSVLTV